MIFSRIRCSDVGLSKECSTDEQGEETGIPRDLNRQGSVRAVGVLRGVDRSNSGGSVCSRVGLTGRRGRMRSASSTIRSASSDGNRGRPAFCARVVVNDHEDRSSSSDLGIMPSVGSTRERTKLDEGVA